MIVDLLHALFLVLAQPAQVEALRASAPDYLTTDQARDHLAAAAAAGLETGQDPGVLLALAHHESRYTLEAVSAEPGNRVSCGVMTPEPLPLGRRCPRQTLAGSYLAGAEHLRGWVEAAGREYLTGYAGGWRLIGHCRARLPSRGCTFGAYILWRARLISRQVGVWT